MLLSRGLLSDGSLYRSASPQASLPLRPRSPSGGWQPAARSLSSSPGSPGASGSLRTLLKQVCSLCFVHGVWCPLVTDSHPGVWSRKLSSVLVAFRSTNHCVSILRRPLSYPSRAAVTLAACALTKFSCFPDSYG